MYKVTLEIADNGIIKTIFDDNYNSAGGQFESKKVYDLESDTNYGFEKTIEFFENIAKDLGVDLGGKSDLYNLRFLVDFGPNYQKSESEIKDDIKSLQSTIRELKAELKVLEELKNEE